VIYSHGSYLSKNRAVVRNTIRRDNFRAMKGQPISVLNMIFHRDFDPGHNFLPNSLQNRFNRAMLSAQARAGLLPTPLHTAFTEVQKTPNQIEKRDAYVRYWSGISGDFYILTAPEECMWKHRLTGVLLGRNIEEGELLEFTEEKIVDTGPLNADNLGTMMWARMKDGVDPGYDTLKNMVMTQGGVGKRAKVDNVAGDAQEKLRTVTDDHIKGILVGGGGCVWLSEFFKMAMRVILDEDVKAN
jgi:hypothetical protein